METPLAVAIPLSWRRGRGGDWLAGESCGHQFGWAALAERLRGGRALRAAEMGLIGSVQLRHRPLAHLGCRGCFNLWTGDAAQLLRGKGQCEESYNSSVGGSQMSALAKTEVFF